MRTGRATQRSTPREPSFDVLSSFDQRQQPRFVEDRDTELLRLGELAPGLGSRDHVARLLRHRPDDLAAGVLDAALRLLAREVRERAGEDEGLAGERALAASSSFALRPAHFELAQLVDLAAIAR